MDLVLQLSDDFFLDKIWAHILPVSAFASPDLLASVNSSSSLPLLASSPASKWSQIISYIPHPPLSDQLLASVASPSLVSAWPRDYIPRQLISLFFLTLVGIYVLYFVFAYISYAFIFNHDMMKHPRFLKNQIKLEIQQSMRAFPSMIIFTLPWFQAEVMVYSMLYNDVETYGWPYLIFSIFLYVPISSFEQLYSPRLIPCDHSFLVFTDYCIYWIHRWEHHPICYKWLHKPHHKWISELS